MAAMNADPDAIPNGIGNSNQVQNDDGTRVECGICGRKFNPEVIQKHENICAKNGKNKRKKFDMKE